MTNAEKFKEVFGFGVCSQTECNDCPLHDVSSGESVCNDDEFWHSNYQGEPTIPLSVIEKITETMEVEYASADELADDRFGGGYSYYRGKASGIKWVKGIIDKAVKEYTHDKG